MASSLSRQLASIAATSTNQLDLRAQRLAHSQSLLFDPKTAATQDFDTLYDHCITGYQDLCKIEPKCVPFSTTVFSESSKSRERGQLTATENTELDAILERFLILSSKHLLLQPTQKALEWLVRRFRVHEFNTETIVLSFLIYHPLPIFSTLLSILPKQLPRSLKFLHPYRERLQAPSGDVIQHAVTTNPAFFDVWTSFVLKSCKWGFSNDPMLSYWTVRVASAVEAQLEPVKAGGVQAQRQREEEVVRKVAAILEKGLAFRKIPSMVVGCFIIMERLVVSADLTDTVVSAFMDSVVNASTHDLHEETFVALTILAQRLKTKKLPASTLRFLMNIDNIVDRLIQKSTSVRVEALASCLTNELVDQICKGNQPQQSQLILRLLTGDLLSDITLESVLRTMIKALQDIQKSSIKLAPNNKDLEDLLLQISDAELFPRTAAIIKTLLSDSKLGPKFTKALNFKLAIQSTGGVNLRIEDTPMLEVPNKSPRWTDLMPTGNVVPSSYFLSADDTIFEQLAAAFTTLCTSRGQLDQFLTSDYLKRDHAMSSPTFVSFFLRYWSQPFPASARSVAITSITRTLGNSKPAIDPQVILPYILIGLSDTSKVVRMATADLISHIQSNLAQTEHTVQSGLTTDGLYGASDDSYKLSLIQFRSILEVLLASLEECKMDHLAMHSIIRNALEGSSSSGVEARHEKLGKSSRAALITFLAGHAQTTPLLQTKLGLVKLISGTAKAGGVLVFEAFQPLLETWTPNSEDRLQHACKKEKLEAKSFCAELVCVILPSSAAGNNMLQKLSTTIVSNSFLEAVLNYIRDSWSLMDATTQAGWAILFFEQGVLEDNGKLLGTLGVESLKSLALSTTILKEFVERTVVSIDSSVVSSPAVKRRKTANGSAATPSADATEKQSKARLQKISKLLELITSAGSSTGPSLLPGLFRIFQATQSSKSTLQNDLAYIHWLLLSCLRQAVANSQRPDLQRLDHSDIRVDLVVDTLTHTTDPQTQYAALMLLSTLAKLEPDLIIHSMMPVFTFIGTNILTQDDEHATYVVDQTINSVIPPLIESFKQHKGGALSGASGLILSFVAAFEHILPSRRVDLFSALIDKLGPEDYLSVLFVVLRDRYGDQEGVHSFVSSMLLKYSPAIQFRTIQKCIEILRDSLEARPKLLKQIFTSDEGKPQGTRSLLLAKLPNDLMTIPQLGSRISRTLQSSSADATVIRSSYADMVQNTLKLTLQKHGMKELTELIPTILGTLIGFFPVSELLRALNVVLEQPNELLLRKVLLSFSTAIERAQPGDAGSRAACFELLSSLVLVIERSKDSEVKRNSVLCINAILQKYGKVNVDRTFEIAQFLVGPLCLQSVDTDIQEAALEALATSIFVSGESIVPICPIIISRALDLLSAAITGEHWNSQTHNKVYSLFTALLSVVPWILTGHQLDRFLELCYTSASTSTDPDCDRMRIQALNTFAKRSPPQTCFTGLTRNWNRAMEIAGAATTEHLQILEMAVEKHSKAIIVTHVTTLVDHFIAILGLRALKWDADSGDWNEAEVQEIEAKASSIVIKMIYKLNDTHFRPQFIKMVEWTTASKGRHDTTSLRRLISWFTFLEVFFSTLQSIVTNYASYIMDATVSILQGVSPDEQEGKILWEKAISTLHATFEHDQDGFWKSPARFSDICGPLINQLSHGSVVKDNVSLIPCITAFAVAVESAEHRAEIHAKILQHFKSEDPRVRTAMFTCEVSLTEALGDEWISLFESSSTYPVMSEAMEDDDESVENEVRKWKIQIEEMTGESLDTRLQ